MATNTPDTWQPGPGAFDDFAVPVNQARTYPYRVNGKIFFTRGGSNYVCSGTVVASATGPQLENEVWTAGHCLTEKGLVDSKLIFVPSYNGTATGTAQTPFGVFPWNGHWSTSSAWYDTNDPTEDEAAFTVGPNGGGQVLGNRTGSAGFAYNAAQPELYNAFGYPAAPPYNGFRMNQDEAMSYTTIVVTGGVGPNPVGIGSDFTGGSSGGGWMIGWSPTSPGYINGHNDFTNSGVANTMFSPYLDSVSNTVRCFGRTTC